MKRFYFTVDFGLCNLSSVNFKIFMTKFSEASPLQGLFTARQSEQFFRDEKMAGSKSGYASRDSTSKKTPSFRSKLPAQARPDRRRADPHQRGGDLATRG